jgi:hypothetical protein
MKKLIFTLGTIFLGITAINAQKPAVVVHDKQGWHKIGETTVDFEQEQDQVAVLVADRFAALKFKVTDAPIELIDIDVIFTEGDKQNIRVGYAIKKEGDNSREIDLKGGSERSIKTITFRYKTIENRKDKKARVEIWGRKTNSVGKNNSNNGAGNSEIKQDANEAKQDVKRESQEVKKEAKDESNELKKDTKKTAKKADKKVEKETNEAKKEAKETNNEEKEEIKHD